MTSKITVDEIDLGAGGMASDGNISLSSGANLTVGNGNVSLTGGGEVNITAILGEAGSVQDLLHLYSYPQFGSHAAGGGGGILFEAVDDEGNKEAQGALDIAWVNAGNGSEDSYMAFRLRNGGAALAENLRIQGKAIRFVETSDPTSVANTGWLYVKDDGSGNTELYYRDESGDVSKLTPPTGAAHAILSATHTDTVAASVVAGDILIGNATPAWTRLAKGDNGQVLTLVSGLPAWATPSGGGDNFVSLVSSYHGYRPLGTVVDSDFHATITSLPGGSSVVYNAGFTGDDDYITPFDGANQQGKVVLHNTTRSNSALIDNNNKGTRTITLTASVPGNWEVGDTITIRSQTCTTAGPNYYFDVDLSGVLPADATTLVVWALLRATNSNQRIYFHPFEAWGEGKLYSMYTQAADMLNQCTMFIPLNSRRICIMGDFGGGNTGDIFGFKTVGYFQPA